MARRLPDPHIAWSLWDLPPCTPAGTSYQDNTPIKLAPSTDRLIEEVRASTGERLQQSPSAQWSLNIPPLESVLPEVVATEVEPQKLTFNPTEVSKLGFSEFIEAIKIEIIAQTRAYTEDIGKAPWYLWAIKWGLKNKSSFARLYEKENVPFWNFMKFQFDSPIGQAILYQPDFLQTGEEDITNQILLVQKLSERCNPTGEADLVNALEKLLPTCVPIVDLLIVHRDQMISSALWVYALQIPWFFMSHFWVILGPNHRLWQILKLCQYAGNMVEFKTLNEENTLRLQASAAK
jgi:hypothetical protein